MDIQEYIDSGLLEAYALGMLTEAERKKVENDMRAYPAIAEAVKEHEALLTSFSKGFAVTPKPEWRAGILAATLHANHAAAVSNEPAKHTVAPQKHGNGKKWLAIAAGVALLCSLAINAYQSYRLSAFDQALFLANLRIAGLEAQNNNMLASYKDMQNDMAIYRDPATAMFVMKSVKGRKEGLRADVLWHAETEMVYVDVKELPIPPRGKQYQLWALVKDAPVDMGVFDIHKLDGGLQKMRAIPGADAFAVTLEKTGGSSSPNLEEMYVYGTPLKPA